MRKEYDFTDSVKNPYAEHFQERGAMRPEDAREGVKMPTISIFYGIIIYMYFYDNKKHQLPHFHASYGDDDAVFSIEDGEVLEGRLPKNKQRLVQAWIEIHREDLMADWRLAIAGQNPMPVKPLE